MVKSQFWAVIVFTLIFVLVGCFQNIALDTKAPRITKEELKSILGQTDVVVVDVRVAEKWLVLKIRDQDPIPKIEGVEIRVKEVVAA
jgi:hypothetical protein